MVRLSSTIVSQPKNNRVPVSNFFILVGPSGSGKTSAINGLLHMYPELLSKPLTYTTRNTREGEVHGRDMYFIPRAEWVSLLTDQAFIATTEYQGELYGTKTADILSPLTQGKKVVAAFDHNGVECCTLSGFHPTTIFLMPTSIEALRKHLESRWPQGGPELEARLAKAPAEISLAPLYDYVVHSISIPQIISDLSVLMNLPFEEPRLAA